MWDQFQIFQLIALCSLSLISIISIIPVCVSSQFIQNGIQFHGHHHHSKEKYKPPPPRTKLRTDLGWIQENLERHNHYRRLHGVPPLVLNYTLCEVSQAWADQRAQGRIGHNPDRGWIGENIYTQGVLGYKLELNGSYPVDLWYEEIKDYDWGTCQSVNTEPIGHFTQVVWADTREMGVATTLYHIGHWDYIVVVANYYPPGNIRSLYEKNDFGNIDLHNCIHIDQHFQRFPTAESLVEFQFQKHDLTPAD